MPKTLTLWVILPLSIFMMIPIIRACKLFPWRSFIALASLAVTYIVGEILQNLVLGPQIIRWYLSDIGWVPMSAFVMFLYDYNLRALDLGTIRRCRIWLSYGTWIALSLETFMLVLSKVYGKRTGGDPVDLAIFVVMYFVTKELLDNIEANLKELISEITKDRRQERKRIRRKASKQRHRAQQAEAG